MIHSGSCLCEAVQFESDVDPLDVGYCHCRMCQKLSGSTVLPWASFPSEHFSYVRGKPMIYRSSSHGQREFCGNCGSQIAFRSSDHPGTVEINVGTMNDPGSLQPRSHIWCESRIPWFEIDDNLPRYPTSGPAADAP